MCGCVAGVLERTTSFLGVPFEETVHGDFELLEEKRLVEVRQVARLEEIARARREGVAGNEWNFYRNNVGGTAALLEVMREYGVDKLVFSSSCAVYGLPDVVPISEQSAYAPINPYGATKMICERMLRESAAAFPLTFMSLRYFNAAGADPDGEIGECHVPETHVIPLLLDAAAGEGPVFTVFGDDYPTADGTCVRDYVHVSDLADAHVKAIRALLDGAASEALNLGTGRGYSVRELIASVRSVTRRDVAVHIGPRRPGDAPVLVADASLARERLGWHPSRSDIAAQVAHAWAWRQGGGRAWQRRQMRPAPVASK